MSEPIVFISNLRIKEGKLDMFKEAFPQVAEEIKRDKPGTVRSSPIPTRMAPRRLSFTSFLMANPWRSTSKSWRKSKAASRIFGGRQLEHLWQSR